LEENNVFNLALNRGSDLFKDLNFSEWACKHIKVKFGGKWIPFSFDGHDYLRQIWNLPLNVPEMDFMKAAQMCISTYAYCRAFYAMDKGSLNINYYFPTDVDVKSYRQKRIKPTIEHSSYLDSLFSSGQTDNSEVMQMRDSFLFLRGMSNLRKVKSDDADGKIVDEVDEANQENLIFSEDRTLHAIDPWSLKLSQPSIPDCGIDASFKNSDQMWWFVKCKKCGRRHNLVETFPKNFRYKGKGEKFTAWFCCPRCKAKIDPTVGEYIAKYPTRSKDHIGVQVSQLYSSIQTPDKIAKKYTSIDSAFKKKNFSISILGLPYRDSELFPFTEELFNQFQSKSNVGFAQQAYSSFMGIDAGDMCHVVVLGWTKSGKLRQLYCEEVNSDDEDRFIELIERYKSFFLMDAMPYKTLAKRLCRRFPGYGAIQYFKGNSLKKDSEGEDEHEVPKVTHDRTESIDEMNFAMQEGFFEFPNPKVLKAGEIEVYEKFKSQVKNLEKEESFDALGMKKYTYKKKVSNHFGMALNSAFMAFQVGKGHTMADVDPSF